MHLNGPLLPRPRPPWRRKVPHREEFDFAAVTAAQHCEVGLLRRLYRSKKSGSASASELHVFERGIALTSGETSKSVIDRPRGRAWKTKLTQS